MARPHGFSLVELTIVVAIIALLAAMALQSFEVFSARARQTEAKIFLRDIELLLKIFYDDNTRYDDLPLIGAVKDPFVVGCNYSNDFGFKISDCTKVRYGYYVQHLSLVTVYFGAVSGGEIPLANLYARSFPPGFANRVFPGCEFRDEWGYLMDRNQIMTDQPNHLSDGILLCQ